MIRLTLPLPPSANRYWRTANGHTYVSAEAKTYKSEVGWLVRAAGLDAPFTGDIGYRVHVYRARRAGDLSNRLKVLEDALNGLTWVDDGQVVYIEAHRHDDKTNPRVEIEIWLIE